MKIYRFKNLHTIINETWYLLCRWVLIVLSEQLFTKLLFWVQNTRLGFKPYNLNISNPNTFNEKVSFIKIYRKSEYGVIVADKLSVRYFVASIIGEQYLIPLHSIYQSVDEIDFLSLPSKFALKTNHGSGWNIICKNKIELDWNQEVKKLNSWMTKNAYYLSREWQYKYIRPIILCEHLLEYEINDVKIFCNKGKPFLIQIDKGRFTNHKRSFYNSKWEKINVTLNYDQIQDEIDKPVNFNEMLRIAEKLSKYFLFCRIDLYEHNNSVYFGEITLHPGGGCEPFATYEEDLLIGKLVDIS